MRLPPLLFSLLLLPLLFGSCATEPGSSTPVAGGAVTKFTYETGEMSIVVDIPTSRSRATPIVAAAVLFDINPETGERTQSTELDTDVSVVWPDSITFTIPGCAGTPVYQSADTYTTFKIFHYGYPAECTASEEIRISASASLTVNKTGLPAKVLNGVGASSGGSFTYHVIFATSSSHTGNLGGLSGADAICALRAATGSARSTLGGTWKALVSTTAVNAKDHISLTPSFQIKNTSGQILVNAASDIWGASLLNAVGFNENGGTSGAPFQIWTGTQDSGFTDDYTCLDWTSASDSEEGGRGASDVTIGTWIERVGTAPCDNDYPIYCINSN